MDLSGQLVDAIRNYGVQGVVYHQHCPMAFDGDGGDWLSEEQRIQNPYLPETRLKCGEVLARFADD